MYVMEKCRLPNLARLMAASLMLAAAASAAIADPVVYTQPFDGSNTGYRASQNDTSVSPGLGNFATTYDNFTLGTATNITGAEWDGFYYYGGPTTPGTITGYTLTIWSDNAGKPGSALASSSIAGNASETLLGNYGGYDTYSYAASLTSPFTASAGTQYWVSVVPDVAFPPQWMWSGGTGGDGTAYQDFFGTPYTVGYDMAFTLRGSPVPEPAFYQLGALLALGGLGLLRLRKRA